jgi:dynein heavy chain
VQIKTVLDEILEKLPEEFALLEIMSKVPPEERTPYVIVAFQECERMNLLNAEIKRSLRELDLGLKVSNHYLCTQSYSAMFETTTC